MRQVRALEDDYELCVLGHGPAPNAKVEYVQIPVRHVGLLVKALRGLQLLSHAFERVYWGRDFVQATLEALQGHRFDAVIANDVSALPVALRMARGAPVIFDAHEYAPREFENSPAWRIFLQRYTTWLCRTFLPQVRTAMTVCDGIAKEYQDQFGISCKVVYNSPAAQDLPVRPVDPARVRMIHHGVAVRARHLELMIDMVHLLDQRFTLDLMLVNSDPRYIDELQRRAAGNPRICFREPVPMEQIAATINDYDIGVFLLPPVNFNYRHALPNKFFEFIQARLAIAVGPSPEMARLVSQWKMGIVSPNFRPASLAHMLNALTAADIETMKRQSAEAAKNLHAGVAAEQLRGLVASTLQTYPISSVLS